jgi:deoxyadenosine/deoxycytidine kinase
MCEFTQYHHYPHGYKKANFDMSRKVIITIKGYEPGFTDRIKEREIEVEQFNALFIQKFYRGYWRSFCLSVVQIEGDRMYDWLAHSISLYNK